MEEFQISTTHRSFETAKANKEGNETHNGLTPHHLSYQSFTLRPLPTKQSYYSKDPNSLMVFHKPTPYPSLTSRERHPPSSSSPYFPMITCFQMTLPFIQQNANSICEVEPCQVLKETSTRSNQARTQKTLSPHEKVTKSFH